MHRVITSYLGLATLCTQLVACFPESISKQANQAASLVNPLRANTTRLRINDPRDGERDVSYFITPQGTAIIDGDVIFGTEKEILAAQAGSAPTKQARAFSIFSSGWPSGTVTYKYPDEATQTTLQPIVDEAILRWTNKAPWLKFVRKAVGAAENGVLFISAANCGGCNANIGYTAGAPIYMNLQQSSATCTGYCGASQTAHEFGHALGLHHEHKRPNRDTYVKYLCENLDPQCSTMTAPNCCTNTQSECCGQAHNFDKILNIDNGGTYDVTSLMHYIASAFAYPGTNTLQGVGGVIVPTTPPASPSLTDADRVCKIFSKWCPKAQSCAAAGCPAECSVIRPCSGYKCNSNFPPACCDVDPDACYDQKDACTNQGCDFLL